MNFDEITKGPVIDVNTAPAKAAESQVQRVERELEHVQDLKSYVLQKAKEFETLRLQYERQLSWAKAEMHRIGESADRNTLIGMREGYKTRDREWLKEIEQMQPDARIAIGDDGYIAIKPTLQAMLDKAKQ